MKSNGEEQQLQQHFLDLRCEDERQSPPFNRQWEAALAQRGQAGGERGLLPVAARAVAVAVLLTLAGFFYFSQQASRLPGLARDASLDSVFPESQPPDLPWQTVVLIYQWQSPTDFLLPSAGERFYEIVSPLGEGIRDAQAIPPADRN